jgi:hypothetical protein
MSARPVFDLAWAAFRIVNVPVVDVGKIIGGKVQYNINMPSGGFDNACPIRMSYVLNKTGFPVQRNASRWAAVSGADGKWYIYKVVDMLKYLEFAFGPPDKKITSVPKESDFNGLKGILLTTGSGWGDAQGHVTLWNGTLCSDTCHLLNDPGNGNFVPKGANLWTLP